MHIAFNGWFWDQPNTGSGQYIRYLLPNLRRVAPDLQMTVIMPPHNPAPTNLPPNVNIIPTRGGSGNLGKVLLNSGVIRKPSSAPARTLPMCRIGGRRCHHPPDW
ncbi:MAG: hypothetical protein H0X30_27780 [Anaerolineae bacterium]|nr:hypothetical protein [Anaerolineae bacterium]